MILPTLAPAPDRVKGRRVPRDQALVLRTLQTAIRASHAAGPGFASIVNDLLDLKLTTARLIDAMREAAA